MFDATEPAALARQLFGPPELDYPIWNWRRRRSPRKWDEALAANWRAIWDTGEIAYRIEVLGFVCRSNLRAAYSLCWEALRSPDYEGILHGEAIAYLMFSTRRRRLKPEQWSALVNAVRFEPMRSTRLLALMTLEWKGYEAYEELLRELASDATPEVALEANLKLRERGTDTADAMLRALDRFEYLEDGVDRIWYHCQRFPLSDSQESVLMNRMARVTIGIREGFWSFPESPSALRLQRYLERGVAVEPDDVEHIGRAVFCYRESRRERSIGRRIKIVEALAWFANDRARDWLTAIRDSESLPKNVRAAAKRELKKLEAAIPGRG